MQPSNELRDFLVKPTYLSPRDVSVFDAMVTSGRPTLNNVNFGAP